MGSDEWSDYPIETMPSPLEWYQESLLRDFESEFNTIVDALVERLLPNFDDIDKEAETATDEGVE